MLLPLSPQAPLIWQLRAAGSTSGGSHGMESAPPYGPFPMPVCCCHHHLPAAWLQWGVAFRLVGSLEQQQETLAYLEWREKQYDKRFHADIYTRSSSSSTGDVPVVRGALVYIATDGPQNVNWLGPAPLADIARQAAAAVGPSGPNYEYIFRLADAMRRVSAGGGEAAWGEACGDGVAAAALWLGRIWLVGVGEGAYGQGAVRCGLCRQGFVGGLRPSGRRLLCSASLIDWQGLWLLECRWRLKMRSFFSWRQLCASCYRQQCCNH